jgi:hypothetical protein
MKKKKIILLACSSIAIAYIYAETSSHTNSGLYGDSEGNSHTRSGFYNLARGGSHTSSGLSDKDSQTTSYPAP